MPGLVPSTPPAARKLAFVYGGLSGSITENDEPRKPAMADVLVGLPPVETPAGAPSACQLCERGSYAADRFQTASSYDWPTGLKVCPAES